MESGYAWRPITVRREGPQTIAQSVMGTFVSGNYFRVFGLTPAAGRFFVDADDKKGAPISAVMSYETWQQDFSADPAVIGGTFWINTKAVTIIGVAPKGFYGDRLSSQPPKYYLPLESMDTIIGAPYLHDPEVEWAYIIGRIKPDVSLPSSGSSFRRSKCFRQNATRRHSRARTSCSLRVAAASRICRTSTRSIFTY